MATVTQTIYNDVANVLLEPAGLTLGLVTNDMFFVALYDVLQDFLTRTGLAKDIYNIQAVSGTNTYAEPCGLHDALYATFADSYIYRDSGFSLDQSGSQWYAASGQPFSWREDEITYGNIQVEPTPTVTGNAVAITNNGYGTISSATLGVDFTINSTNNGYGVISDASTGNVFVDPINEGLGTPYSIVASGNNLSVIGITIPVRFPQTLNDPLPLVPDSYTHYIRYGILARLFTADSEAKDLGRAQYCIMRYNEGVDLLTSLTMGDGTTEGGKK